MKIAILGLSPLSLNVAKHFTELEAMPTIFSNKRDTDLDLEGLQVISAPLIRVQKRSFPKSKTQRRLRDLFRVVYEFKDDPTQAATEQTDPIDENIINSLNESIETFKDFDLIIDLMDKYYFPRPMGAAGTFALNELRYNDSKEIYYGKSNITELGESLVIVGDGQNALDILLLLAPKLLEKMCTVSIITLNSKPFFNRDLKRMDDYKALMSKLLKNYEEEKESFQGKVNDWKSRPGVQKPIEPSFPLKVYSSYQVSSLDRLVDREGLFLTLEKNSELEDDGILTVKADNIFVCCGYEKNYEYRSSLLNVDNVVNSCEPGYYNCFEEEDIAIIEKEIRTFFSQVE